MKKVITAIGNEKLNLQLKKEKNIEVISNDIQYKEGILETLEKYQNIDFLIINSLLPGYINLEELIIEINIINRNIKIIIILEYKNELLEKKLYEKNVYKIIYNNQVEISDLLKIINEENINNEELKKEIEKLKNIILEKDLENNFMKNKRIKDKNANELKNNKKLKNINSIINKIRNKFNKREITKSNKNIEKNHNKKGKVICIIGPTGVGKSIISINLSKINIYSKNKILIMDFDLINNSISTILGVKKHPLKDENNYLNNLIKINKKIDLLVYKNNNENREKENIYTNFIEISNIIKKMKEIYNYIIIDTNSSELIGLTNKLLNISDFNLFITDTNLLEINKSIKLLSKYINELNINKNKINILFNKYNKYSISKRLLKNIFNEFNIIGFLNYNEKYNKLINKNNRNNFKEKKLRKEYLEINEKINEILDI